MKDTFQLKPVRLSETVYSETWKDYTKAIQSRDIPRIVALTQEAQTLLIEAGVYNINKGALSYQQICNLLRVLHLDAQV